MKHIPVLLDAVLNALGDVQGLHIVDCTFGAGGYTRAFLERGANVTAFDRDPNVLVDVDAVRAEYGERFNFIPRAFSSLAELDEQFDAIVFDLGISSMQIDNGERGFSFRMDAPLDMRMDNRDKASILTAAELIENTPVADLAKILHDYGDVRNAMGVARAIKNAAPKTTFGLRDLIHNPKDIAPIFQALRIAVNDEMGELERALDAVPEHLKVDGKCICVTFHSIEDRIVKNTFRELTTAPGDPRMPTVASAPFVATKTALPDNAELENNPRARSAHMRGVIKVA
ncbi:MAG: 16S rRNA (cytosine(1402)-N(4))-methyltransferase RsmH [Alphaproteobacteria bacterium]|nr:16S rRNA (cytosine(1402)-N(4))-methyltransferase RsmH [Alphaproteobacteria bacterium]